MFTTANFALFLVIICFSVGLLASFLPILPGTVIAWAGIVIHKLWLGDASVPWWFLGVATGLVFFAQGLDMACTYWGAKKFGASWRGALGGVAGGLIGVLIFNLPGLIIGPLVGVVLAEIMGGRNLAQAGRAGVGTIVGGLVAFVLKLGVTVTLIAGFFLFLAQNS